MRKRNILMDVLSQLNNSKAIFRISFFCSLFWKKNGKKRVFCDFLKNVDFW